MRTYNENVEATIFVQTNLQRVLGLDVGLRRIGLALSDPLRITAQGIPTLVRKNLRYDMHPVRAEMSMRIPRYPFNSELWLRPPKIERQGHRDTMFRERHPLFDKIGKMMPLTQSS